MKRPYLSIIVPVFNEEVRIKKNLEKIYTYFSGQKYSWEMLIVDDGSVDKTPRIIKDFARRRGGVRVFRLPINQGKGGAVRKGVEEARGEIAFFTDVDLSTPIEEIEKLLRWIDKGYDIVMGSRRMRTSRIYRSPGTLRVTLGRIFYRIVNFLFLPGIHDTNCGFKAYKTDLAKKIFKLQTVTRWGFDAEILYIARKHGAKIKEIAVPWTHYGGSKVKVVNAVLNTLREVVQIKTNDALGYYEKGPEAEIKRLYRGLGWTTVFSHIRLWDAPYKELEKKVPKKGKILDLGCGEGFFANYLALTSPARQVSGIDKDKARVRHADRGLANTKFINGDITKKEVPEADTVLLVHVLHHLSSYKEQEELLRKCRVKLKRNGKMVIVEIEPKPSLKYLVTWLTDHFLVPWIFERRLYSPVFFRKKREWTRLLRKSGFSCKVIPAESGKPFTHAIFICESS